MRLIVAVVAIAALMTAPAARAAEFVDVSFKDAQHGWALVTPCPTAGAPCTAVEATSDGGRTWRLLAKLPASARGMRIDSATGVAFGETASFVASDGGRRWTRVRGMLLESALPAVGATLALTYGHSGCPGPCDVILRTAPRGSARFAAIPSSQQLSFGYGDTLVSADGNLLQVAFGHISGGARGAYARVGISRDSGRSWSFRADPCKQAGPLEIVSTEVVAAGSYVALLCLVRTTGASSIALSRDGGRSFERVHPPANGRGWYANEIAIDATGDLALLESIAAGDRIVLSYDRGRTWRVAITRKIVEGELATKPTFALFGRSLRWALSPHTLLRSDDAGRTWQPTAAP